MRRPTKHITTIQGPRLTAAVLAAAALSGCEPALHQVELSLSTDEAAIVTAIGEAPVLSVVNAGPGRIEVTFDPGGAGAHGPHSMPPDSVMAWTVHDSKQVMVAAMYGEPTSLRVRAIHAEGIEGPRMVAWSGAPAPPEMVPDTLIGSSTGGADPYVDPEDPLARYGANPYEQREAPESLPGHGVDPEVDPDNPLVRYPIEPYVPPREQDLGEPARSGGSGGDTVGPGQP